MAETTGQITLELVDKLTKGLNEVNSKLDEIGTRSKNAEKQSQSLGDTLKKLSQIAGIAFISKQILDIGKSALKTAGDFEQYNVAFKTMLGSAGAATKLLNEIKNFAATTPFELTELVASSKQLLAFNFAADEIIPTLTTLGNIAAGVGVPVSRLGVIFGQVKLAGRLMGQDLLQFTNAGVPLISQLAKNFGTTEAAIKKMVEQGKIGFADVKKALEGLAGPGGKFNNLMIAQSKTLGGVLSNIGDNFTQISLEIGNAMLPIAKVIAVSILDALNNIRQWFQANQESIKNFFFNLIAAAMTLAQVAIQLGTILWTYVIEPLFAFVKSPIVSTILAIVAAYYAWVAVTGLLVAVNTALAAVNPLGWIVIGIAAAVVAFNALKNHWSSVVNVFKSTLSFIYDLFKSYFGLIIKIFTGNFMGAINDVINGVKKAFSLLAGKNKKDLQKQAEDLTPASGPETNVPAQAKPAAVDEKAVTYKAVLAQVVGSQEAIATFAKIGQGFKDYVVDGILNGTLTIDGIWANFTQQLYKMMLEQMFNPIGAAMGVLANSIMTIFNDTIGQLITPFIGLIANMVLVFAGGILNFKLLFTNFGAYFTGITTLLGQAWTAFTSTMVGGWIGALVSMLASLVSAVTGAILAFALMAASASAAAVAMIPFVGPALAIAAYGATFALVMAGTAKLATVALGLASGATSVIGGASSDTVPAMLTPGEMVVPQGIADGIRQGDLSLGGPGGSGPTEVILSFKDGAIDFIEAQIVKRNRLGGSAITAG